MLPGRSFPQALLQELLAVAIAWQPPQRALAHEVFGAVLPAAGGGLVDAQTHSVLSALWHEVCADPGVRPCVFHNTAQLYISYEDGKHASRRSCCRFEVMFYRWCPWR